MVSLDYFEADIIGRYSQPLGWATFSSSPGDAMQKTSVGLEDFRRFSSDRGDFLITDFQCRLSYDNQNNTKPLEFQVYNLYARLKKLFLGQDLWLGHYKIPFGAAWSLDDHSHLMSSLQMFSLGFDRDWGLGIIGNNPVFDYALGVTLGSGMGLYNNGNCIVSARFGFGDFSLDNYNLGISLLHGNILPVMGYSKLNDTPKPVSLVAADATYLFGPFSLKGEADYGADLSMPAGGGWLRFGFIPPQVQQLNIEIESKAWYENFLLPTDKNLESGICFSYKFSEAVTARLAYFYRNSSMEGESNNGILQVYLFPKIF